jgi:hypothetical protein
MKSPWSFPTSPRSPNVFIERLKLIQALNNSIYNKELQARVGEIIREASGKTVGLKSKSSELDFVGRDYLTRAPKKLGAVFLPKSNKGKFVFTEQGYNFIQTKHTHFILQRQIAKIQYPSPISSKGTENIQIIPLTTIIHILNAVKNLSRYETSIFIITIEDYRDIDNGIKKILNFRDDIKNIKGNIKRRKFRLETSIEQLKIFYKDEDKKLREKKGKITTELDFIKTKLKNHRDYADAIFRYFLGTGLFKLNKNSRLEISEINKLDSDFLLKNIGLKPKDLKLTEEEYVIKYLGSEKSIDLFSDKIENLNEKIKYLEKISLDLNLDIEIEKIKYSFNETKSIDLKKDIIIELQNLINFKKMKNFISDLSLRKEEHYQDIIKMFEQINDRNADMLDRPLFYEYNFFRAFSFIGFAVDLIPSMKFDEDTNPINTTPNAPDLIVEYENFILVVEVTLTTGQKQYESEGNPVFRHVGKCQKISEKKEVFGIFIPEKMDETIPVTFLTTAVVKTHIYNGRVRILPMTREQFLKLFKKIYEENLNHNYLYKFLKEFLSDEALLKYQELGEKAWMDDLNKKLN